MRRQLSHWPAYACLMLALFTTPARAEITIAVVGGMSGPFTKIGKEFTEGTRGAVAAINEAGGVLGKKLTYVVRDSKCDAKTAVEVANEMAEMRVPLVVGHLCSDASIAASEVYEKAGIIQISPSSTNPKYTDRGLKNVFRTTGRDDMQGFVIAEHILRSFKTKKLGIAFEDDAYTRGVAEVTRKFINQGGLKEKFYLQMPKGTTDFAELFDLIRKHQVSVLLFPTFPGTVVSYAAQMKKTNMKVRLIGGDSFSGITFTKENRRHFDGFQCSFPPDPAHDRRNKAITKRYKKEGYKPEAFTFYTYGAVQLWAQAANKAGTLNAEAVATALRARKYKTVLGEVNFDAKGDISNPGFVMYFFNKGKRYYLD